MLKGADFCCCRDRLAAAGARHQSQRAIDRAHAAAAAAHSASTGTSAGLEGRSIAQDESV